MVKSAKKKGELMGLAHEVKRWRKIRNPSLSWGSFGSINSELRRAHYSHQNVLKNKEELEKGLSTPRIPSDG